MGHKIKIALADDELLFRQGLKSILENEETHQKFRKAAFEHAKTFDIGNILPIYESYYKEIIEKVKSKG